MARSRSWMIKSKDSWSDQGECQHTVQKSQIKMLHQIRKKNFIDKSIKGEKSIEREMTLERENSREKKNLERENSSWTPQTI